MQSKSALQSMKNSNCIPQTKLESNSKSFQKLAHRYLHFNCRLGIVPDLENENTLEFDMILD